MMAAAGHPTADALTPGGPDVSVEGDRSHQTAVTDTAPDTAGTTAAPTTVVSAAVGAVVDAAGTDSFVAPVATLDGRRKSAAAAAAARTARAEAAVAQARDYVAAFTADHGCEPTGRELGERFGRSEGWGLGVLRKLRESTPEDVKDGAG
jgi:hypothetical protein